MDCSVRVLLGSLGAMFKPVVGERNGEKYCIRKVMENNQEMEGGKMKAFGALAFCIAVHPGIELNAIHEMHL